MTKRGPLTDSKACAGRVKRSLVAAGVFVATAVVVSALLSGCGGAGGGGGASIHAAGDTQTYDTGGGNPSFTMIYAPGGLTFPTGITNEDGDQTVACSFWIGETEVPYELWVLVRTWAVEGISGTGAGKYTILSGTEGDGDGDTPQHPVTEISWRDAMVWTNALTEYCNANAGTSLGCVYKDGGIPIRDSSNATLCDGATPDASASGFRLLTSNEWELTARYIGTTAPSTGNDLDTEVETTNVSGTTYYWTPGEYASGAADNVENLSATSAVAWWGESSDGSTHIVKDTANISPNGLGLYDMSGNVNEWCFTLIDTTSRVLRGGSYNHTDGNIALGTVFWNNPGNTNILFGFRVARNAN